MLADAILMLERARIIDFNGYFSARVPGTDHMLINPGKSVRSALTAADIVTVDMDEQPCRRRCRATDGVSHPCENLSPRPDVIAVAHTHSLRATLFCHRGKAGHHASCRTG